MRSFHSEMHAQHTPWEEFIVALLVVEFVSPRYIQRDAATQNYGRKPDQRRAVSVIVSSGSEITTRIFSEEISIEAASRPDRAIL